MKYYIIAGEASGDLHAANLMKALKKRQTQASFRAWGGDLMQAEGGELVEHYRNTAFMGFWEVAKNLRTILAFIDRCKKDILTYKPDLLILVDYPGFNLRIAEFAQQHKIPVCYYISPQVWAWKQKRVEKIKKWVDQMLVILPFEKDFYKERNYSVDFVGHPLLDAIEQYDSEGATHFKSENDLDKRSIVALLPGSRQQEIKRMLPLMAELALDFKEYQFVLAGAPNISADFYDAILKETLGEQFNKQPIKRVSNQTYQLLQVSYAAIVTSGTATLETALFGVPQVVCYKGNWLNYEIGKRLVKIEYISLVNLILNRPLLTELIQDDYSKANVKKHLNLLLSDKTYRKNIENGYTILKEELGNSGASDKAADLIVRKFG